MEPDVISIISIADSDDSGLTIIESETTLNKLDEATTSQQMCALYVKHWTNGTQIDNNELHLAKKLYVDGLREKKAESPTIIFTKKDTTEIMPPSSKIKEGSARSHTSALSPIQSNLNGSRKRKNSNDLSGSAKRKYNNVTKIEAENVRRNSDTNRHITTTPTDKTAPKSSGHISNKSICPTSPNSRKSCTKVSTDPMATTSSYHTEATSSHNHATVIDPAYCDESRDPRTPSKESSSRYDSTLKHRSENRFQHSISKDYLHRSSPKHRSSSSKQPYSLSRRPSSSSRRPSSSSRRPSSSSRRPSSSSRRPPSSSRRPPSSSHRPSPSSQRPSTSSQRPSLSSQRPSPSSQRPPLSSQRPSPSSQRPPSSLHSSNSSERSTHRSSPSSPRNHSNKDKHSSKHSLKRNESLSTISHSSKDKLDSKHHPEKVNLIKIALKQQSSSSSSFREASSSNKYPENVLELARKMDDKMFQDIVKTTKLTVLKEVDIFAKEHPATSKASSSRDDSNQAKTAIAKSNGANFKQLATSDKSTMSQGDANNNLLGIMSDKVKGEHNRAYTICADRHIANSLANYKIPKKVHSKQSESNTTISMAKNSLDHDDANNNRLKLTVSNQNHSANELSAKESKTDLQTNISLNNVPRNKTDMPNEDYLDDCDIPPEMNAQVVLKPLKLNRLDRSATNVREVKSGGVNYTLRPADNGRFKIKTIKEEGHNKEHRSEQLSKPASETNDNHKITNKYSNGIRAKVLSESAQQISLIPTIEPKSDTETQSTSNAVKNDGNQAKQEQHENTQQTNPVQGITAQQCFTQRMDLIHKADCAQQTDFAQHSDRSQQTDCSQNTNSYQQTDVTQTANVSNQTESVQQINFTQQTDFGPDEVTQQTIRQLQCEIIRLKFERNQAIKSANCSADMLAEQAAHCNAHHVEKKQRKPRQQRTKQNLEPIQNVMIPSPHSTDGLHSASPYPQSHLQQQQSPTTSTQSKKSPLRCIEFTKLAQNSTNVFQTPSQPTSMSAPMLLGLLKATENMLQSASIGATTSTTNNLQLSNSNNNPISTHLTAPQKSFPVLIQTPVEQYSLYYNQGQVTQGQVTQGEVTQAQVTQGQVTQAQVTQAQVMQAQVTHAQVTQAQVMQAQVTQPQISQAHMTQAQVTQTQFTQAQYTPFASSGLNGLINMCNWSRSTSRASQSVSQQQIPHQQIPHQQIPHQLIPRQPLRTKSMSSTRPNTFIVIQPKPPTVAMPPSNSTYQLGSCVIQEGQLTNQPIADQNVTNTTLPTNSFQQQQQFRQPVSSRLQNRSQTSYFSNERIPLPQQYQQNAPKIRMQQIHSWDQPSNNALDQQLSKQQRMDHYKQHAEQQRRQQQIYQQQQHLQQQQLYHQQFLQQQELLQQQQLLQKQQRIENERIEKERIENERIENERIEKERIEKERIEKEKRDQERFQQELFEQQQLEQQRANQQDQRPRQHSLELHQDLQQSQINKPVRQANCAEPSHQFFCLGCQDTAKLVCATCRNCCCCSDFCYDIISDNHRKECRSPHMVLITDILSEAN